MQTCVYLLPGQCALFSATSPEDRCVSRDPSRVPGVREEVRVHHRTYLGMSTKWRRWLHLPLSPTGSEDPQTQTAAGMVQEDAGQGCGRADRSWLQGRRHCSVLFKVVQNPSWTTWPTIRPHPQSFSWISISVCVSMDMQLCLCKEALLHISFSPLAHFHLLLSPRTSLNRQPRTAWQVQRSCLILRVISGPMCWRRASKSWSKKRRRGKERRTTPRVKV